MPAASCQTEGDKPHPQEPSLALAEVVQRLVLVLGESCEEDKEEDSQCFDSQEATEYQ